MHKLPTGNKNLVADTPFYTVRNELQEEIEGVRTENIKDIKLISIVYNSERNFDMSIGASMAVDVPFSELRLKGKEHDEILSVDITQKQLEKKFFELCEKPKTNSGHFRGHLAALYAHEYGIGAFDSLLNKAESILQEI